MKFSITVKSILAYFFFTFGYVSLRFKNQVDSSFVIPAYHRVIPKAEAKNGVQAGMYVDPATFDLHLRFLTKYFSIIPISQLLIRNKKNNSIVGAKPVCALTFDDGWKDFYQYAYPVLKKHQVPATIFLPTDFIGTNEWFWTDRLTHLLANRVEAKQHTSKNRPADNLLVQRLDNLQGTLGSRTDAAIEILKPYVTEEIGEVIACLSNNLGISPDPPGRAFLSWDEVEEMSQSGLVTFGSHTATHRILTTLKKKEIESELRISREKLLSKKIVDPSFIPFCYPNGNYDENIAGMVRQAGYNMAVTTKNGWNHQSCKPFTLRRIGIHQDMTSTKAMYGCRIANIF